GASQEGFWVAAATRRPVVRVLSAAAARFTEVERVESFAFSATSPPLGFSLVDALRFPPSDALRFPPFAALRFPPFAALRFADGAGSSPAPPPARFAGFFTGSLPASSEGVPVVSSADSSTGSVAAVASASDVGRLDAFFLLLAM